MKVIIYGLRGVGIETAKNLTLQGVGAITLMDSNLTEAKDIGVNFFLHNSDIGKPRALVVEPRLRELNLVCKLSVIEKLTDEVIGMHNALVITQPLPIAELITLNEACRKHKVSFFYAFTSGVSTDIFVDHGPDHVINDPTGDKPIQKLITDIQIISDKKQCLIRYETPEGEQSIALFNGFVEISEVKGIAGFNGVYSISRDASDPVKTIRVDFESTTAEDQYIAGGGIITEKKIPYVDPMCSLQCKLKSPGDPFAEPPTTVLTDLINFGSEIQQHVAFYATLKFFSEKSKFPKVGSSVDTEAVLDYAKSLVSNHDIELGEGFEIDEKFLLRYATYSSVELQPLAAFTGGVLAQEVVKSTGKFTPIPGFMHFSAVEALPDEVPSVVDTLPKSTQYDELASIYGWNFIEKLGSLKYFMVGCGALGCEFMKNFALNGICCGPTGKLVVTDADRIELSNLSRQFLFREHNVGQPKSKAAAIMAKVMNPDFNVESLELFVGPKSEDYFNDDFWDNLDGVCNALDNMEARLYVDQNCVKYEKSLLESGTMGTSGNIDTICPFKTRTYKDGGNAAEGGGVPMCTLRNFPHLTDHCIEWARDQFELLFSKIAKTFEAYILDPTTFEEKIKSKAESEPGSAYFDIRSITSFAKLVNHPSIFNAAQLSYDIFHFLFRDKILDLQSAFPVDARIIDEKTKQDNGPFWGEKKRYPTVVVFDPTDESHTSFMLSATCLFSVIAGLIPPKHEDDADWLKEYRSTEWITNIVSTLSPPLYIQAPVNSEGLENAPKVDKAALLSIVDNLLTDLRSISASYLQQKSSSVDNTSNNLLSSRFETIEFEKDDDNNFHISFITATSNLRCDNYAIKRTDFHSCKVIAGKIIAAIATTTAAVCGLVILELFKLVLKKDTDAFMNRAIGLSQFTYTSFTQEKPREFESTVVYKIPDPTVPLHQDAYDESGKVKKEFMKKIVTRAYPEKHSVWHKIVVPGSLTLKEFARWLEDEHQLALVSWDFIYGHRNVYDEEEKKNRLQAVSTPIYPQKVRLDFSLIPSLDLDVSQATRAIMKTPTAKPTQQYINLWKEFKSAGSIPPPPPLVNENELITESTTLKEILLKMSKTAELAEIEKKIETKAIPNLTGRRFFVLPGSEAPQCRHIESDEMVDDLCSFKIIL